MPRTGRRVDGLAFWRPESTFRRPGTPEQPAQPIDHPSAVDLADLATADYTTIPGNDAVPGIVISDGGADASLGGRVGGTDSGSFPRIYQAVRLHRPNRRQLRCGSGR